ncbi:hypothetical protein JQ506_12945 [Shinella sp. PSBB067]|uniref:hypothetical protein n=1 Tax=Shinella sp. PSBB067 TaxID=2715959 RepID=UPI00193C098B|nr:hypothetical protein [Shinella sp. PSBB067]QRI61815.1 hypothetical protein JQ506_12945 [Shinella sp. PSBB067]
MKTVDPLLLEFVRALAKADARRERLRRVVDIDHPIPAKDQRKIGSDRQRARDYVVTWKKADE